jgi:hypothetical protein
MFVEKGPWLRHNFPTYRSLSERQTRIAVQFISAIGCKDFTLVCDVPVFECRGRHAGKVSGMVMKKEG